MNNQIEILKSIAHQINKGIDFVLQSDGRYKAPRIAMSTELQLVVDNAGLDDETVARAIKAYLEGAVQKGMSKSECVHGFEAAINVCYKRIKHLEDKPHRDAKKQAHRVQRMAKVEQAIKCVKRTISKIESAKEANCYESIARIIIACKRCCTDLNVEVNNLWQAQQAAENGVSCKREMNAALDELYGLRAFIKKQIIKNHAINTSQAAPVERLENPVISMDELLSKPLPQFDVAYVTCPNCHEDTKALTKATKVKCQVCHSSFKVKSVK